MVLYDIYIYIYTYICVCIVYVLYIYIFIIYIAIYIYLHIVVFLEYEIVKTMCPPSYHLNGFEVWAHEVSLYSLCSVI